VDNHREQGSPRPSLIDALQGRRLIVVMGKGGVGKSTVAAAIAQCLADRGLSALLLETDPRESQHQLLGCHPSGGALVDAGPNLLMQNADAEEVIGELLQERVPIRAIADRIRRGSAFRQVVAGAPGLKELALMYHASRLVEGTAAGLPRRVDSVVLDAPATGHGLGLLRAPTLVAGVIEGGPVRHIADDVDRLVKDPGRTGMVAVCQAEELPADELLELLADFADLLGRDPQALVVNGVYPSFDENSAGQDGLDELTALWRRRREINERQVDRLLERWSGPWIELPLLPVDRGPALVAELGILLSWPLAAGAGTR
jgi:anion-transporting  ArsA/GET3 family ATPase